MIELSIIILTYGNAELLRACLEALSHQTQSATEFEVIVVACNATDATREMLDSLVTPYRLRVIWQVESNPSAARNRGAEATVARYCLFLDDDIIADPRLVAKHLRVHHEREKVVGLGQLILSLPCRADAFARYLARERQNHNTRLRKGTQLPSFMDCSPANLSVPRAALLAVGGFAVDLSSNEGAELGYRLERQGLSFVYIPDAIGRQDYRKGFRELAADVERAGAASIELHRRHPPMLPHLQLGAFYDTSRTAILLRRLLLAIGAPIRPLAIASLLLGKRSWARKWYRFLASYCYWRGVRRAVPDHDTWCRLIRSPVILMYHALGAPGEPPSRYVIPRRRFAQHMAWLKWRAYHVLSLEEFLRHRYEYRLPPARSVIVTFDDGYADNRAAAYPILRQHGFPATIFLVSGLVGSTNQWDSDGKLAGRPLLSWSDIREMLCGGVDFGAHTRSHVPLTDVTPSRVKDEIEGSRADLERALGLPILAFAYPHGEYNPAIQAVVKRAGFLGACSSDAGVNDPIVSSHALRRLEVCGTDSLIHFVLALWLGIPARSHSYGSADDHAEVEASIASDLHEASADSTPVTFIGSDRDESCTAERGHRHS